MPRTVTESTREGGREDSSNPSPELPEVAATRNSSGNRSPAAQVLDLRLHIVAIEGILDALARQGLIDDATIAPLRLLRQRGFRSGR